MDHCLPAIEKLVHSLKDHVDNEAGCCAYELEARLGYINPMDNSFKPGVSEDKFDAILTAFTVCSSWHSVTDFAEVWDVMYDGGKNKNSFRTTTSGDNVEHCEKTKMENVSMCASGRKVNATGDAVDIRVALARERLVLSKELPHNVEPQFVRVKQRKSFLWGAWRWDLSRVWEGASLLEVDAARASQPPRYEVEIELIKSEQYLKSNSVAHAAASLLLKLHDMVYPLADDPSLEYFLPEHFQR
jgi:hypothetical protein